MDRLSDETQAEQEKYALHSLFADIGGAAGLFLGLSVLGIGYNSKFTQVRHSVVQGCSGPRISRSHVP